MKYYNCQPHFTEIEKKYLNECYESGFFTELGEFSKKFCYKFNKILKCKNTILCSNGTSGLFLALKTLKLTPKDEIIISDTTMIANAEAVLLANAKPVMVDINLKDWNMDINTIINAITQNTKAIIITHLYGMPFDIATLKKNIKKINRKIIIIEDTAEAHFAKIKNNYCGTIGDFGIFSFYANKIITMGEGGAIVCKNKKNYEFINNYKNHFFQNRKKRFIHDNIGFNFRITNMQAAIGLAQLERYKILLNKRIIIKELYKKYLTKFLNDKIFFAEPLQKYIKPVNWITAIRFKNSKLKNNVINIFNKEKIEYRNFFYPMHKQKYLIKYKFINFKKNNSSKLFQTGMLLPTYFNLNEQDIKFICKKIGTVI